MTRRIAAAILLTVWAILVAGGFTAYWVTRLVLLEDLDRSLVAAAESLPDVTGTSAGGAASQAHADDRYVIKNGIGQTIRPPERERRTPDKMRWQYSATFAPLGDGRRVRTVTVHLRSPSTGAPVTVVYSRPTNSLDRVLGRLAAVLTACAVAAGAAAAAVAVAVARAALRPLHVAADVVGVIDEQKLDRRIDESSLPPELRPVASRLNGMLERLERGFAQRRQFLSDASHELRTPVAALVTTLEVALRRKRDAAELIGTLESCLSDARYLRRLVTVLLEHARGETSPRSPAPTPFDAAELLTHCATIAESLGAPRDVRIVRAFAAPISVVSESDRVRGIVTNLLANAVEHNRPGGTVELAAVVVSDALDITVRDTGPGIAPEHLPHLFQPFYRTETSRWRNGVDVAGGDEPHLGLGLFIVDAHLRALGGKVTVTSEVGVGTTMRVSIPGMGGAARKENAAPAPATPPPTHAAASGC